MLGTRSLIGLILSLLVHAGAVAFFVTQNDKKEKPKPKKITLQMAIFQTTPAKSASAVIKKPTDVKPDVVVTPPPQAVPVVASKPKPIAKVKPLIKKKKRIKKALKKTTRKVVKKPPTKPRKARPKKKVVTRQPRPVVRRAPPPVYRKPPVRRVAPAPQRVVKPIRKIAPKTIRPVIATKPARHHQQGNPLLEKQYGKSIYGIINQKKNYPRRAKRRKIQGIVKVAFSIAKNGLISNLRIHQSSGSSLLDKAALNAVREVGRFPSIPNAVNKQMLSYIIPLSYRLR